MVQTNQGERQGSEDNRKGNREPLGGVAVVFVRRVRSCTPPSPTTKLALTAHKVCTDAKPAHKCQQAARGATAWIFTHMYSHLMPWMHDRTIAYRVDPQRCARIKVERTSAEYCRALTGQLFYKCGSAHAHIHPCQL